VQKNYVLVARAAEWEQVLKAPGREAHEPGKNKGKKDQAAKSSARVLWDDLKLLGGVIRKCEEYRCVEQAIMTVRLARVTRPPRCRMVIV